MLSYITRTVIDMTSTYNYTQKKPVEKYKILKPVGTGSYSSVFKAVDNNSGCIVAIKEYLWKCSVIDVQNEKNILQKLSDIDGVLQYIDYYETDRGRFLVTKFVDGEDLFTTIEQGTLSRQRAYVIFEELLRIVEEVHRRGVIHRDLKPENIMIERTTGKIYVIDWGFAEACEGDDIINTSKGTLYYSAPEVLSHPLNIGKHNDVWSLGVILFTMISYTLPFTKKFTNTDSEIREMICNYDLILESKKFTDFDTWLIKKILVSYDVRPTIPSIRDLVKQRATFISKLNMRCSA